MRERSARTIWMISKYLSSREYGFETRGVAIARQWAASGRTAVIIASDSNHLATFPPRTVPEVDETLDGVRFRWLTVRRYAKSASVARVLSWLHFEWRLFRTDLRDLPSPDVVIVSSLSLLTVLNGIRIARTYGVPLVFEVRDIWPLTLTEEGGMSPRHPLAVVLGWIEALGYRRADLVVGTMPNLSPHASRVAGRPIHAACVPFGFTPTAEDDAVEAPDPAEDGAPAGTAGARDAARPLVVGYAGSIGLTNALDTFVDCVQALDGDPRFRFVVLGDGAERERYMRQTASCRNVEWIGRVPREAVGRHLRQCDVLYFAALPSAVWDYGMSPNKFIDYMRAGRPIIASYSGYPSMLDESGGGVFIPAADGAALRRTLEEFAAMPSDARRAMGARGRAWLRTTRTWDALASQYAALLDDLVRARAGGRPARA